MKRAIVNFSNNFNYDDFREYSEHNKISLSRALLELAQKSLTTWKDEQIADIALDREDLSGKEDYVTSNDFWKQLNV